MSIYFAENLRKLRIEKGLSQQDLADRLHVERSTVTKWETGKRLPDAAMIAELSECLDTDVSELLVTSERDGEKPKVIIVDDEQIILSGCMKTLMEALPQAEVTGFRSPSEALEYARGNKVALAFLDIEMGNISGLDVCRELLTINPHTNVIYLTVYKDYAFDAWETGACGFMLKPLTAETVHKWIPQLKYSVRGLESDR